jgi:hypothetical protein
MFRPLWSSSGVKIIVRWNCSLLLLLMLLIYKSISPLDAHMFELVGCILSCCVLCCMFVFETWTLAITDTLPPLLVRYNEGL